MDILPPQGTVGQGECHYRGAIPPWTAKWGADAILREFRDSRERKLPAHSWHTPVDSWPLAQILRAGGTLDPVKRGEDGPVPGFIYTAYSTEE